MSGVTAVELPVSQILDKAADAIVANGWRTGGGWWPEGDGRLCLEGGLIAALGLTPNDLDLDDEDDWNNFKSCPAYVAVKNYIGTNRALWSWNDDVRDQERVIGALRGAAEAERQKEAQA